MASLYTVESENHWKSILLFLIFFSIFLGFWYFVIYFLNLNYAFLYFFVFLGVFLSARAYFFSHKIVTKMTNAREITRKEYFNFWNAAENICISIGSKMPKLYVIEDDAPNAFATGRNPDNSVVVATTGLLQSLDKQELEGVIAHEIAHIQNRDTLVMSMAAVLVGMVVTVLDQLPYLFHFDTDRQSWVGVVALIILAGLSAIFLTLLKFSISRRREFLADSTGALYTRHPDGLISALRKISDSNLPMKKVNSAVSHLFISDPYKGKKENKFFAKIHRSFSTHPPIEERIAQLEGK